MRAAVVTLAFGLLAVGMGAGCGGDGTTGQASCALSDGNGVIAMCEEGAGLNAAQVTQLRQVCTAAGAGADAGGARTVFADGPCSRAGALGGCRQMAGPSAITIWYYATSGLTEADIQMFCTAAGATFVAP